MNIGQRRLGPPRLPPSSHRACGTRRPRRWNPGHTRRQDLPNPSHNERRDLEHQDVMLREQAPSRPAQQNELRGSK